MQRMSDELALHVPEFMTHDQEKHLAKVSDMLAAQGWQEKKIVNWWQTKMVNLNGHAPIEALCADKFDLVYKIYDKTMRIFEYHKEQVKLNIIDDGTPSEFETKLVEDESVFEESESSD